MRTDRQQSNEIVIRRELEGRCAQQRDIVGKRLAWSFAQFPYLRVTRRANAQAGHMRQEILDGDFAGGRDRVELDWRWL
jgi:hypothetical protein